MVHVLDRQEVEDPAGMVVKWVLTVIVMGFLVLFVMPMVANPSYEAAFVGVPLTAVCGLVMAIAWRRNIANLVADPIASLYSGGNEPPDPHPFYSVAQPGRNRAATPRPSQEIRKQLERFPTDVEGHLLWPRSRPRT